MPETPGGAECGLVKADGEGGENRRSIGAAVASERLVHVLEAALHRDAVSGQKRQLRGAMSKLLQRGESIDRRDFADGVHLCVNVERRQASGTLA